MNLILGIVLVVGMRAPRLAGRYSGTKTTKTRQKFRSFIEQITG